MEQKKAGYYRRAQSHNLKNKSAPKIVNLIKETDSHKEAPKGNATGVCSVCGKTFEQDFYEDRNTYSSYKTCHGCRKKVSEKKEKEIKETETATAMLPFAPHPWQAKAFEDFKKYRFNLWACGNRSGRQNSLNIK